MGLKSRIANSYPVTILLLALLIVAAVPGYRFMTMVLSITDEPYQALNAMTPACQPFAPLSAWLIHAFGEIAGYDLLGIRLFAWSWQVLGVALGIVAAYLLSRKLNLSLAAGVAAMLMLSLCHYGERYAGWSSFSATSMPLVFIALICYMRRPDAATAASVGLACSFATLLRLPSVACTVVVTAMLIFYRPGFTLTRRERAIHGGIMAGSFLASALLVLILIYGSLPQFFSAIAENRIGSHGFRDMINSLITLSKPTFAFFFITMGIAGFVAVIFRDIRRHLVRLILVAMLFICSYYALRVAMQFDFARGILKVSFLTLVACLLWMRRRESMDLSRTALWVVAGLSLSAATGSNMTLLEAVVFPLLPATLVLMWPYLPDKTLKYTLVIVGIIACWFTFRINQRETVHRTHPVAVHGNPKVEGIEATAECGLPVQKAIDIFTPFTADSAYNCFVVRDNSEYIYEYMFGRRNPILPHYWDTLPLMDVEEYAQGVRHMLDTAQAPAAVLLISSRGSRKKEPELISDMKRRYRTVHSDTTFTIVVKDR